ncbi:DNA cytosine methyltransferase [Actinoalloteichus sp. GBA129-24]|uniref:DNA cytosine methyltransferase n=1 Tax=Actinoalloteichus sp. GBA129-24 TaxID=1612551 RepID=UPI0009506464|nr:DNA cytosine methyltransferase [Actinoalloteichus sp. GBA129-24]APU20144.1 C-5 cytosine-specific DNA methylase [Actinoalloteichus sp. GBA129-24]
MSDPVNVLHLFEGIGGFSLGCQRAGMRPVGQVEIDPWCRSVLARHWPEVPRHDDVRTAAAWWQSRPDRPRVDVITGGFPCQPVSVAGRRRGVDDDRWLWPAMADVIAAIRPRWVLWENVPGLRTAGLDVVHADLVRLGYRHRVGYASACEMGAPHPRRRLLGLAHTHRPRRATGSRMEPTRPPTVGTGRWPAEPDVGRVAHGLPGRVDRVTALGNAVVPRLAEHMARLILAHHDTA